MYAEYGKVISPCTGTTNPCYYQNYVDRILTINTPLPLNQGPATATMLSDVKYSIPPLNYGNVLSIIACGLYYAQFKMWNTYYRKTMQKIQLLQQSQFTHIRYEIKLCYMCVDQQYYKSVCLGQIRQFIFLCDILVPHTDFVKSQPTFHAVQGKEGLILSEELCWKSDKI